ncbi:MAG: class I SAM-dependent RNA methyltransferase [Candidatus Latescibacteria bacterium]|jgi:23S rRNA (uracil1939-C5)-methyltransferase|nr:class I SAM-dependent RNA methyltransferase [Candidatus Latescibacterota bacterium]
MPPSETILLNSLAYGGDAVGRLGEKVIFVPDGVPGDVIRVSVREDKGSFLRGVIEELVSPSPERVTPFCPLASRCGGCQWQAVSYSEQLRWKQAIVEESLRRISGIDDAEIEPCLPSPIDRGYRTSVRYPAAVTGKGVVFGYYGRRSHNIIDIDNCPVACDRINSIASNVIELFAEHYPGIHIRELSIHASQNHPSSVIGITTFENSDLTAPAKRMLESIPGLAGIRYLPSPSHHVRNYGKSYRYERIGEKRFRISERSFFQVNAAQTEKLTGLVSEMLDIESSDIIVDGYGGVGLFSLSAAPLDTSIHLYDLSRTAVKDSLYNAREMGFTAFTAHEKDTHAAVHTIGHADLLILDPPRQGLGRETVEAASVFGARAIVYVSCNPTTLARDIKMFSETGYSIERVVPIDMFPHTFHIETVVKLRRM